MMQVKGRRKARGPSFLLELVCSDRRREDTKKPVEKTGGLARFMNYVLYDI